MPLAIISGSLFVETYAAIGGAVQISDFARKITKALQAFAELPDSHQEKKETVEPDDAIDLREVLRPVTGKNAANLNVRHIRVSRKTQNSETVMEWEFGPQEIDTATANIERTISPPQLPTPEPTTKTRKFQKDMLVFDQASRHPGKEQGRTSDKALIPEVTSKPLPVFFRDGVNDLKSQMVKGNDNPLTSTYFVDAVVNYVDGEPKGYMVTEVHKVVPEDD